MDQKKHILLSALIFFMQANACSQVNTVSSSRDIIAIQLHDVLLRPENLVSWTADPPEISFYSREAVRLQKRINETHADAVITCQTEKDSSEWTEIEFEHITPFTWKWLDMELQKQDGSMMQVSLRRPCWWITRHNAERVGNRIFLDIPEMGVNGYATVSAVRMNQLDTRFWVHHHLNNGYTSQPVTGKFVHHSANVLHLYFEGQKDPLGVTSTHPLWSMDRNNWVEASSIAPGEKVKTYTGIAKLVSAAPVEGTHTVYNLEVYRNHNYHVSSMAILAHNHCLDNKPLMHIVRQSKLALHTKNYDLLKVKPGQGHVNREKVKDLFDQMLDNRNFWNEIARKNQPIIIHRFADGKMIVRDGHHRFLALSAASRVEGFKMPDLNNEKIFLIKDFDKSSAGQHHFEWDALVELNYKDYEK